MPIIHPKGAANIKVGGLTTALDCPGAAGDRLDRLWTAAGSSQRWSVSMWVKVRQTGMRSALLGGAIEPPAINRTDYLVRWEDGGFRVNGRDGTTVRQTTATSWNNTDWQHIVAVSDLAQAALADKFKVWIDGAAQALSGTLPTSWDSLNINNATHGIGETPRYNVGRVWSNPTDAIYADVNFINDIALTGPGNFGTGTPTTAWTWQNIYAGSYGTTGFRLLFEDDQNLGNDSIGSNNWTERGNVAQETSDLPPQ